MRLHEPSRLVMTPDGLSPGALLDTVTVGGVNVSRVTRDRAVSFVFDRIAERKGGFVTATSAHGIVEAESDARFRTIMNQASMVLPDGAPLVWAAKLHGVTIPRFPGNNFFEAVLLDPRASTIKHYFYGSQEQTVARVVSRAAALVGADAVVGAYSPPFRPAGVHEDERTIAAIAAMRPDVIWVGLSTPKQEYWMANHAVFFPGTVLVGIGAAFDFFAGVQRRAPAWMGRVGLEWAFRLFCEPIRLWPRYRRVLPAMIRILAAQALQHRLSPKVNSVK